MPQHHDTEVLIDCLAKTPLILSDFLQEIPSDRLKERRRPGKWSIHENVCHLAQAEKMIHERFERFRDEVCPVFSPYLPGATVSDSDLMDLNLSEEVNSFTELRAKTVKLLKRYDDSVWGKSAEHPQYYTYNARILLRHTLMHDHFHMYRIEELWLSKPEFL
mgnify:CR=1 FL=1